VEPPSIATLLDPVVGAGEELEPEPNLDPTDPTMVLAAAAPWSAVFIVTTSTAAFATASSAAYVTVALSATTFFIVALSVATFTTAASSATFTAAASSTVFVLAAFSATATAAKTSLTIKADPSGAINTATLGSGCSAVATPGPCCPNSEGPLTVDPPLWNYLVLLCRGTSSCSDDTSILLSMTRGTTLPFSLSELGPVLAPPWLPAMSAPGIWTPQDSSPLYRVVMSILSSVGITLSSLVCTTWSEHMGAQGVGAVSKSTEDGSGLSIASRKPSTFGSRPES
jgi:hypothetical protein